MRIFLSSTYEDLVAYRAKAAEAIERVGQQGSRMEVFGARTSGASQVCFDEIDSSDALIGIYAHRYGYIPSRSSKSITEQEFDHARDTKRPIFAFLLDENYPWPPVFIDRDPGYSHLVEFKKKITETVVRDLFTTPDDLAYRVAASLGYFLIQKRVRDDLEQIPINKLGASEQGRNQVARRAALLQKIIKGSRVLLVNDVPSQMSHVISILEDLGIEVEVATTSEDGLGWLSQAPYDLVISDMMRDDIPDEGMHFLREMRGKNLSRPTIFTVGKFKPEMGTPAYAFGITDRVDELLNLVFDVLERTRG